MNPTYAQTIRDLALTQQVAALGTLHDGKPFVSMVPFALLDSSFVIHVSSLAAHTEDMQLNPDVSLMVMGSPAPDVPVQGLARITVQGRATPIQTSTDEWARAKAAYLTRFPQSEPLFDFSDFSLFAIEPITVRVVGGFAQAKTISKEDFAEALNAVA